ncbi:TNF receptor-associated factor 5-like isoform X2 [Sycon ciliatum]|uniref:TNF receptor-associated factor 5-like isoform X2 n=1 Tax=Sycon ciliatum TaxID=27933 RepID=UPI0031F65756
MDPLRRPYSAPAGHVRAEVHSSRQRHFSVSSLRMRDFPRHVCTDGRGVEETTRSQLPIRCSSVASGSSGFLQHNPRMPLGLVDYDQRMPAQETVRESSGGLFQPRVYHPGRAALPERTIPPLRLPQDVPQHEGGSFVNRPTTLASRREGTSCFSTGTSMPTLGDVPASLKCPICRSILCKPVQTACGHRYCMSCLDSILRRSNSSPLCPVDSQTIHPIFADKHCERQILALPVHCHHSNIGCPWRGTFSGLPEHLLDCDYEQFQCLHVGCTMRSMVRRDMDRHIRYECVHRIVTCEYCSAPFAQRALAKHQRRDCAEYSGPCPNACCKLIKRGNLDRHTRLNCSDRRQTCPFNGVRCEFQGTPAQVTQHCTDHQQQHLVMVARELGRESDAVYDHLAMVMLRVAHVEETLSAEVKSVTAKLARLRQDVETRLKAFKRIPDSPKPSSPAVPETDLRLLSAETSSYDGVIIFKINNFTQRLEDARTGQRVSLYSPTFHTGRHGYKVCLRVYLNGDGSGKGSHISVFFTIMKGEFDGQVSWPFRFKVTFAILDQGQARHHHIESFIPDPHSSSFQKPVNNMNIASGCPKMISHSELYDKQTSYLRDDCLYIKAWVGQSASVKLDD